MLVSICAIYKCKHQPSSIFKKLEFSLNKKKKIIYSQTQLPADAVQYNVKLVFTKICIAILWYVVYLNVIMQCVEMMKCETVTVNEMDLLLKNEIKSDD